MLYHLLYPLHTTFSAFNVFRYITFRTIYASLTAFFICFLLGPWMIEKLASMQVGQYIRDDGPKSHFVERSDQLLCLDRALCHYRIWPDRIYRRLFDAG